MMIEMLDEHRHYLDDAVRLEAFRRALALTVRPGDIVLDLGAGTGILGLLACAAGAGRVYAVDDGPALELAKGIAAASPYADRIVHLRGHSSWVELPERVDLIVADQIGHFGYEAGLFDEVCAARDRWLTPGGRVVPQRVDLWVAPVEIPSAREAAEFWSSPVEGFDVSAVAPLALATARPVAAGAEAMRAPGARIIRVDVGSYAGGLLAGEAEVRVTQPGRMDGLLGWFVVALAPGVTMTNAPDAEPRVARRALWLPVGPLALGRDDRVDVCVTASPGADLSSWEVQVSDRSGCVTGACRRSSLEALPISAERLRATASDARPSLSREGQAVAEVLVRCDGHHALADIEHALAARFPEIWSSPAAAGPFVASILARHAR